MDKDMAQVTIIIPNYNGIKYLNVCLDSLERQTVKDFQVLLVDNGSTDGSVEEVKKAYPKVDIFPLDKNYGFCRAVNEGIRLSKTSYVLLLNNDVEADSRFVEELLKAIKKDDKIFSVASKMLQYDDREKIDGAGDLYCALGWAFALGKGRKEEAYGRDRKVFSACGGAAIYRREVFEVIGYFDELHFAYLEDVDVGYRAKIMGYENVYASKAIVYHVGSGFSGSRYNSFKVRLASRNSVYLIYKNMPTLQILLNLPFFLVGFGIKTLFFIIKGYGREYLSGIKRGYLLCTEGKKLEYSSSNLRNYVKIQWELWWNVIRRIIG